MILIASVYAEGSMHMHKTQSLQYSDHGSLSSNRQGKVQASSSSSLFDYNDYIQTKLMYKSRNTPENSRLLLAVLANTVKVDLRS